MTDNVFLVGRGQVAEVLRLHEQLRRERYARGVDREMLDALSQIAFEVRRVEGRLLQMQRVINTIGDP